MDSRRNLTVLTNALVNRLLIRGRSCAGVELLLEDGSATQIRAGEVILCGGVFGSPQLLMLSGIGPAGELRRHGIDVVADLPGTTTTSCSVTRTARPTRLTNSTGGSAR
jgi:choline dehydrogenase